MKGSYRNENQDRIFTDPELGLFLIADGLGGYVGGAKAAEAAISGVADCLKRQLASRRVHAKSLQSSVWQGIEIAQRSMQAYMQQNPECDRMGTTFAGLIIRDRTAYFFRLGDCRLSLSRRNRTIALTRDETLVEYLVDCGQVQRHEARTHPNRNVVVNCLFGDRLDKPPTIQTHRIQEGDCFVLTTDGVTDEMEESEIQTVLDVTSTPHDAAELMVNTALDFGSRDNVSCIVVNA